MTDTTDYTNPLPCMPTVTGVPVKLSRPAKVKEALGYCGFGRTKLYQLLAEGKIEAFKDGGTTLIDLDSVDRYRASLPAIQLKRAG